MNYSTLKPIGENVLLEVIRQEKIGNIHLPEERTASEWQPVTCCVLGVGSSEKIEVKKGDNVIVNRLAGHALKDGVSMYKVVSYKDILCVIS